MSEAGKRLIAAANEASQIAKRDVDVQMLRSMATALRAGLAFSFNADDMADLLDRVATELSIRDPEAQP